eukprot:COSAG01_NODE_9580_length_2402_cov_39.155884_1_plen_161_part_00
MTAFLSKLRQFDPREELTRFGPFATLSNATRHAINQLKVVEYGRYHRLPVFRWRWGTATTTPVPDEVYDSEPSMWGYFCEGAPIQVAVGVNPARGVANGTCATLVAMRFGCAVPPTVRAALARSGEYDGDTDSVHSVPIVGSWGHGKHGSAGGGRPGGVR